MKNLLVPLAFIVIAVSCVTTVQAIPLASTLGQLVDSTDYKLDSPIYYYGTDFSTGSDATSVTSLTLALNNYDRITRTMIAELWSDNAGQPGSLLATIGAVTVPASSSGNYTVSDAGISLGVNTIYWLVLHAGENHSQQELDMSVTTSSSFDAGGLFSPVASTDAFFSDDSGATWSASADGNTTPLYELAGNIVSSGVPDAASTAGLLGFGLAGLLALRRRVS